MTRTSDSAVAICAIALLVGTIFMFAGAAAIWSSAAPLQGGLASVAGLALLLGSERLARSPFRVACVVLLGIPALAIPGAVLPLALLSLVSGVDALLGRPLEAFANFAMIGAIAFAAWLAFRWSAWRLGRNPGTVEDTDALRDGFNHWIFVLTMYMVVLAGAMGFLVILRRMVWIPH
jgi:hypothetical protein